jgi:hypothetical protein
MDKIILSLGPAFAAGLAVQQLLEIADRMIEQFLDVTGPLGINIDKKLVLGLISLFVGLLLAAGAGLRVLRPLGIENAGVFDVLVTGLIISAGTESFNAIVKFLGYVKEDRKVTATVKKQDALQNGTKLVQ